MEKNKKKLDIGILILLLLLAVFIRVYRFGAVPGGMNQDGAMAAVDAQALAMHGTDRLGMRWPVHLTAWGFGQMSALLSYLMAPMIRLFGLSVLSARLPMLLVSLASLWILYRLGEEILPRRYALAVLFLAAVCPWHILQSRWALDCNLFPHFFLTGVLFLVKGIRTKKRWFAAAMVFFALSMYCYGISIYTVPLFLLAAGLCLLVRKELTLWQALGCALVYLLVAGPFLLCMALNTFGLGTIETPLFTIPAFPGSLRAGDILFFSPRPGQQLLTNLRALFTILAQQYDGALCNEVPGFGTLYRISLPFQLIGLWQLIRRSRRNSGCLLLLLWLLTALLSGCITASVNVNRINLLFYPLLFCAGIGLAQTMETLAAFRFGAAAAALLPAAFLAAFGLFTQAYFTTYAQQISAVFMEDFGKAVSAIRDSDAQQVYISPDAQYKGLWYVSEVLTLFYQDIDAEYYQSDAFRARYHFSVPTEPDPAEDAVYVLARSDLPCYPEEDFFLTDYGRFLTAIPKRAP